MAAETNLIAAFKTAWRTSTPLVAVETPDPAATVTSITGTLKADIATAAWDAVRGLKGLNKRGIEVVTAALAKLQMEPAMTLNCTTALEVCLALPANTLVFVHNAHRQLPEVTVMQALWNARDEFKANKRMFVLLGPSFTLPSEIANDVIVLEEPLPTRAELESIVLQQYVNASLAAPDAATKRAALDAVVGLPAFTTEQVVAMSLTPQGVDIPKLWHRKTKAVESTEGLRVKNVTGSALSNLKGIDNVLMFMQDLIDADAFGAIAFIDEGDKAFAGGMAEHTGDSGVAKDQVGQVLTYVEDTKSPGVLLAGVAGCGKTELAHAVAATSGKPLIMFDLGGMKGGHVGDSERAIRQALKVLTATAEGRVLFLMTANRTTHFTPELNRRFPDQFFFDIPTDEARAAIWPVYVKQFGLTAAQAAFPAGMDAGWTGAEIRRACQRAALLKKTVVESARYIIPQAVSAATVIEGQRKAAAGKFLSASYPGFYMLPGGDAKAAATGRTIDVQ